LLGYQAGAPRDDRGLLVQIKITQIKRGGLSAPLVERNSENLSYSFCINFDLPSSFCINFDLPSPTDFPDLFAVICQGFSGKTAERGVDKIVGRQGILIDIFKSRCA
jgi:hypothetical protein